MDRLRPDGETDMGPVFTRLQLHAEFTYSSAELGRSDDVQRFAATVAADASGSMDRRKVLVTAALASPNLTPLGNSRCTVTGFPSQAGGRDAHLRQALERACRGRRLSTARAKPPGTAGAA